MGSDWSGMYGRAQVCLGSLWSPHHLYVPGTACRLRVPAEFRLARVWWVAGDHGGSTECGVGTAGGEPLACTDRAGLRAARSFLAGYRVGGLVQAEAPSMPIDSLPPRCGASRTYAGSPWTPSIVDSCAQAAATLSSTHTGIWATSSTSCTCGRCAGLRRVAGTLKPQS